MYECLPHMFRETECQEDTLFCLSPINTQINFCLNVFIDIDFKGKHNTDLTDLVSRYLFQRVPCRPTSDQGLGPHGGTAAGLVYSAVGLPRSRGKRGCVQGLINHGHFGRDKQARPSRDAAAPAADRGEGMEEKRTAWKERRRCGGVGGRPEGVWMVGGDGGLTHQGIHNNTYVLVPHLHGCTGL